MKKLFISIFYIIFIMCIFIFFSPTFCFAAYPKLITTLTSAFESIETWLIRISTPAAAVAVRNRYFYEKI